MKRKVVSVADLNRYVARLLDEDYVLADVWVQGEVSNCKYHSTGHIYFTIKDNYASIQSVMFSKDASKLDFQLEEGRKGEGRCRRGREEKKGREEEKKEERKRNYSREEGGGGGKHK